jgi:hypothetical protein
MQYAGIPFAEPPLGNLRFAPPVLKTTLDVSSFDASQFGAGCLQRGVNQNEGWKIGVVEELLSGYTQYRLCRRHCLGGLLNNQHSTARGLETWRSVAKYGFPPWRWFSPYVPAIKISTAAHSLTSRGILII